VTLVLFDIDLTLVHTNGAGRLAMENALVELYGVANPTDGISFDGRTDRAIFQDALARLGDATDAAIARLMAAYLARLPGSLAERGGRVLPGVPALLDALAAEGAAVGLATGNLRAGAMAKLGHFGLWERFAAGGFGDAEVVRARVVREAITALAAAAGRGNAGAGAVVVGDTPLDVEAARAAGARALAVATGRYSIDDLVAAGADAAVADLSDTSAVLDLILS
jgi:phosphoglycolate phosphatase-like HAD superfamily hydrolase